MQSHLKNIAVVLGQGHSQPHIQAMISHSTYWVYNSEEGGLAKLFMYVGVATYTMDNTY